MIVKQRDPRNKCFGCDKAINDFAVKKYCDEKCKDFHNAALRKMNRASLTTTKKIGLLYQLTLAGTREQKRVSMKHLLELQEMINRTIAQDEH